MTICLLYQAIKFSITTMIHEKTENVRETEKLAFFSPEIAAIIGVEAATVFSKIQWCVENPDMTGTIAPDGAKYIRNPVVCTSRRKLEKSREHGKLVDWLSNFTWASFAKLRRIFANLEEIGLIIAKKIRAQFWDQCKYYTVNYQKLAELLKRAPLPICQKRSPRSVESDLLDLSIADKSYQDTFSEKVFQKISPREASGSIDKFLETKKEVDQEKKLPEDSLLEAKVVTEILQKNEILQDDKCSVRSSSVERQLFFERILEYCYQRVDLDSPEGYANWVLRESKSKTPEASVALLWDEFIAGEELGSRLVPPGFKLRGVPEKVVAEAITQDCIQKVGTTPAEAAKNAASQLRRLPVVAAVATAVKLQLERAIEGATRQIELGIPKAQAISNNLPTYASACVNENTLPLPELASAADGSLAIVEEIEDPYAPTPDSLAARERARAILNKKFNKPTKTEEILAANIAEAEQAPAFEPVMTVIAEEYDDEPIPW